MTHQAAGIALVTLAFIAMLADWSYTRWERRQNAKATWNADTERAIREALAAVDETPQWVTFAAAGRHPACGVVEQVWTEPHPAAVAEQMLRDEG